MRFLITATLALLLATPAMAVQDASSGETARALSVRVWALHSDAKYGEMWTLMHPAQQRRLGKAVFIACERKAYGGAVDDTVAAIGTRLVSVPVSGTGMRVPGVAVTVSLTTSTGRVFTFIQNVVKSDGAWRWVMRGDDFRACPAVAKQ
jgi:hypothetical protein